MSEGLRLLNDGFLQWKDHYGPLSEMSRLEYLADFVFEFTTYDSGAAEFFASRAIETCLAITNRNTFDLIENRDSHYWYLSMLNMPFFIDKIEWGSSIRGAWWRPEIKIECAGLFNGDSQLTTWLTTRTKWEQFTLDMADFVGFKQ